MPQVSLPSNVTVYSGRGKYTEKVPAHLAPEQKIINFAKDRLELSKKNKKKEEEVGKKRAAEKLKIKNKQKTDLLALKNRTQQTVGPKVAEPSAPGSSSGANIGGNKK